MKYQTRAAILSVGDELTLGQTLDTNSRWIAQRLIECGIVPQAHFTTPDDAIAIRDALRHLAATVDVLVVTGGLGPTADDLTREALAAAFNDTLLIDEIALSQVEAWFIARKRQMSDLNRSQALRPSRGTCLPNLHGTAPGLSLTHAGNGHVATTFCLPGPPNEMKPMFEAQVVPRLHCDPARQVLTRTLHCFGIAESELATRLGTLMDRGHRPLVGTTASAGVISIRIRHEGPMDDAAVVALAAAEMGCRAAAAHSLFGSESDTLPGVTIRLLQERAATLATIESCTGGLLGSMLIDVPGASTVFPGGIIAYSNEQKQSLLGIPAQRFTPGQPGAVSAETAMDMAASGLKLLGTTHSLAITGIAGPGGGTKQKPVGTVWIARASNDGTCEARSFLMIGDRANIRHWSAMCALAMLRQKMLSLNDVLLRQTGHQSHDLPMTHR